MVKTQMSLKLCWEDAVRHVESATWNMIRPKKVSRVLAGTHMQDTQARTVHAHCIPPFEQTWPATQDHSGWGKKRQDPLFHSY